MQDTQVDGNMYLKDPAEQSRWIWIIDDFDFQPPKLFLKPNITVWGIIRQLRVSEEFLTCACRVKATKEMKEYKIAIRPACDARWLPCYVVLTTQWYQIEFPPFICSINLLVIHTI